MMARILAHQRDLGNGVGLHYSGFHRFSAVPAPSNQLLASIPPRKNRYYCQPIREDGLTLEAALCRSVAYFAEMMMGSRLKIFAIAAALAAGTSGAAMAQTAVPAPGYPSGPLSGAAAGGAAGAA